MTGWALACSVFGIIFIAELPDKTALATLTLSTRHRPLPVLIGAGAALTIQSLVAVMAGHFLSRLPSRPVHIASGLLFVVSAVLMWRRKEGEVSSRAGRKGFWRSASLVFALIFAAEWGDLTQLATAALEARYSAPFVVFAGSACALWAVAAVAVFIGERAGAWLHPRWTARVASGLFAVVGAALVAGAV